jgi:hypothetical protein
LVRTGNSIPRNIREIEISHNDRRMSLFHGSNFIQNFEKGVEFRGIFWQISGGSVKNREGKDTLG